MPTINTDEMSATELLSMLESVAATVHYRDRDQFVTACPLSPKSLTGSYFIAPDPMVPEAEAAWDEGEPCSTIEGQIVGQPFITHLTTMYLVEFFGKSGATGHQQLIDIDQMLVQRWAFYDTEGWLQIGEEKRAEGAAKVREQTETKT